MIRRRRLIAAALAAPMVVRAPMLLGTAVRGAWAASGSDMTLIVGAPAGSSADLGARAFVPFLERHLPRTQLHIVNMPGDAGLVAFRALAAAAPDSGTLGWISTPSLPARTVDRSGAENLLARMRLIAAVAKEPICIVSTTDSPLASAQDIITRSSENADAMPLGTPPAGSAPHLAALRLQALSGTTLNIVAFPSATAARQAALAGNVEAAVLGLGDAIESLRASRLNGLGIAARHRADAFPDMPPLRDSGLALSAFIHRGLAAPAGLDDATAARLRAALAGILDDIEFHAQGDSSGFVPEWLDGPDWTAQAVSERADLARLWQTAPWLPTGTG